MRMMATSLSIRRENLGEYDQGDHSGPWLPIHLKETVNHFELTEDHLLGIMTDDISSN